MNNLIQEEKVKPFRLVKLFTYISLIVSFIGTILISALNTHWAKTMLFKKSDDYAHLLVENLNHQIFLQFFIPVAIKFGKIQLRDSEQFEHLDRVIRATLHSFQVQMVNIYDMNNVVSYSFDKTKLGKKNTGGDEYWNAIKGKSSSRLEQDGNFLKMWLGSSKASRLITFDPLRAEKPLSNISGPVLGVIEIVQDLSDDYQAIINFQMRVVQTCAVVMGILLTFLILVVKRGEEIIESRAQEKLKLKEQLSRAERLSSLGEMAAAISHEIRNPLGIIRSSAEHLKKKMANFDPTNTITNIIVEEANRVNNIITDFLSFARPMTPNLVLCHVQDILEKNINFFSAQIEDQNYKIEKEFDKNLPDIMADANLLYQAFLNLLLNAKQAMPNGGIIHIYATSKDGNVVISFEDEGLGLSKDISEKVWNPFFTTKDKGTGLGLGIVKNIIESHGGSITLENLPVKGAMAIIMLPIK